MPQNREQWRNSTRGGYRSNSDRVLYMTSESQAFESAMSFTMRDEARQTMQKEDVFWRRDIRLRNQPVSFISFGLVQPLQFTQKEIPEPNEFMTVPAARSDITHCFSPPKQFMSNECHRDMTDSGSIHSEDEVVLFRGRGQIQMTSYEDELTGDCLIGGTDQAGKYLIQGGVGLGENSGNVFGIQEIYPDNEESYKHSEASNRETNVDDDGVHETIRDYIANTLNSDQNEQGENATLHLRYLALDDDVDSDDCADTESVPDLYVLNMGTTQTVTAPKMRSVNSHLPSWVADTDNLSQMDDSIKEHRLKRADKRRERQAQRQKGVLRRTPISSGLSCQYEMGMSLNQIADEIRQFLDGQHPRLVCKLPLWGINIKV